MNELDKIKLDKKFQLDELEIIQKIASKSQEELKKDIQKQSYWLESLNNKFQIINNLLTPICKLIDNNTSPQELAKIIGDLDKVEPIWMSDKIAILELFLKIKGYYSSPIKGKINHSFINALNKYKIQDLKFNSSHEKIGKNLKKEASKNKLSENITVKEITDTFEKNQIWINIISLGDKHHIPLNSNLNENTKIYKKEITKGKNTQTIYEITFFSNGIEFNREYKVVNHKFQDITKRVEYKGKLDGNSLDGSPSLPNNPELIQKFFNNAVKQLINTKYQHFKPIFENTINSKLFNITNKYSSYNINGIINYSYDNLLGAQNCKFNDLKLKINNKGEYIFADDQNISLFESQIFEIFSQEYNNLQHKLLPFLKLKSKDEFEILSVKEMSNSDNGQLIIVKYPDKLNNNKTKYKELALYDNELADITYEKISTQEEVDIKELIYNASNTALKNYPSNIQIKPEYIYDKKNQTINKLYYIKYDVVNGNTQESITISKVVNYNIDNKLEFTKII